MRLISRRAASVQGYFRGPSDKSLTHRAYMFAAMADGLSRVSSPLRGEDCESTLRCMGQLGLGHEWLNEREVLLTPAKQWRQPSGPLDCGNSGTTIRLLSGLVASRDLDCTLVGDASLSRRPMRRIADPLRLMGAQVEGDTPPLRIRGSSQLHSIRYQSPVASGQIKSCILLAGLRADGETVVQEPSLSRDHTERMLKAMGAAVISRGSVPGDPSHSNKAAIAVDSSHEVSIHRAERLRPFEFTVPADISSAAFFMVAACALPEGRLSLHELSVNPTRTGILDVLEQCGVQVHLGNLREELGEPVADVEIAAPKFLKSFDISGPLVPRLIDEIPVLAVLATQCEGISTIRDAAEVRVKESDRLALIADGLQRMGANVQVHPDGLTITGPTPLKGVQVSAEGDHRIAMSFAIAGLLAEGDTEIEGAETIATSFPDFEKELQRLVIL